jgi:NADH:ubiquinone reductase (non-electrogenic)
LVECQTLNGQNYVLPYDILVVGVGFQPNDFNTPGVKEHALFMKETADATRFKDHVLAKLEEASYIHALDSDLGVSAAEEERIKECLTFVVVGGGPTGVELAGELTDFLNVDANRLYPELRKYIKVHMFTFDVLGPFDKELQEHAIKHLRKKQGVDVHLESFVTNVTKNEITTKHLDQISKVKYGTLVWCAGVKPHEFIKDFNVAMNERGTQILCDATMQVKGEKDIYAIGDCCTIEDYWLPQTAQVANQQAEYLAKTLSDGTLGKGKPFVFFNKGMMAYLGGMSAVMSKLPGLSSITGFVAFLGWRFTYWFLQLSVRNRYMLSTDWLRTLIFGRDLTRFGKRSRPT